MAKEKIHVKIGKYSDIEDLSWLDNLVWGNKCPEPTGLIQFWNNQDRNRHKTPWLGVSHMSTPPFCSLQKGLYTKKLKNRNEAAWAKILKHGSVLTVRENGVLIGAVAVVLFRYGGDVHGRVHKVTVHPEHRLSGIGTALMRAVVRLADQHSLSLSLSVNKDNPVAVKLYKKAGFNVPNKKDLSQHTKFLSESGVEFSFYDNKIQLVRNAGPVRAPQKIEEVLDFARKNAMER